MFLINCCYSVAKGSLPETIFIQIDGGSENANTLLPAFCTLLACKYRKLGCKKIVLTRLPVGHTHEDCDAQFGVIWRATRNESICTPQEYKKLVLRCLGGGKKAVRVVDLMAVPDYEVIFKDCIDQEFGQ